MTKQQEAQARISELIQDRAFGAKFVAGDAAALAMWRSLHQAATARPGAPPPAAGVTPETARANLDRLRVDSRFAARLLAGEAAAISEWRAAVAAAVDRREPAGA